MSKSSSSSSSGAPKKQSDVQELQQSLSSLSIEKKREAVRKIIDVMTRGKDVSMLFMDVIKNMEEKTDMELKKLIYLYIINYAQTTPDLAILAINSFRKDARDKVNPLLRALAVRTMGCIRVKQIAEYLVDPLKAAIKDQDSYVRQTAAICIAQLYDVAPDLIEQHGFLQLLEIMMNDGNPMVVSNAVVAQMQIQEAKGEVLLNLTAYTVQKLLTAMNDCNEWGIIYILDALALYTPADGTETENILERVAPRLSHSNSGVVLSAIRVIMKFLDYIPNPENVRNYLKKLTQPILSLLTMENEIVFVSLKNINLILQKKPLFLTDLKMFFCTYKDPIYIKLQKIQVLIKLANMDNYHQILHELKEYTNEVDIEYVKKSVRAIGRIAVQLERAAEKCVQVLWECLQTQINYVVQETIIVIRDIFRQYPQQYEAILQDICENIKSLDDPEARSSMIWIIGEYVETIDNADVIIGSFADGFKDETPIVQHQIMMSSIKLFLCRPQDGFELAQQILKIATNECENPDLRDRGYIYWRMLGTNPELAQKIVYSDRPAISEQSYTLETEVLDKLIDNIGTLASVYYQVPEKFVQKLRDMQNLREIEEQEYLEDDGIFMKNVEREVVVDQDDDSLKPTNVVENYEAGDDGESNYTSAPPPPPNMSTNSNLINLASDDLLGGGDTYTPTSAPPAPVSTNIVIPPSTVLTETTFGMNNASAGLNIDAAFQRNGDKMFLEIFVTNKSPSVTFNGFAIKFAPNSFKLQPISMDLSSLGDVAPGKVRSTKIEINAQGQSDNSPPSTPFKVSVLIKTNLDVFNMIVPCSLTVLMVPGGLLTPQTYMEFAQKHPKQSDQIATTITNAEILQQKFANNNLILVGSRTNQTTGQEMHSFSTQVVNEMPLLIDLIIDQKEKLWMCQYYAPHPTMLPLFYQALNFINKF